MIVDELVGWHHCNGHEFEQTLGDSEVKLVVQRSVGRKKYLRAYRTFRHCFWWKSITEKHDTNRGIQKDPVPLFPYK